MSEFINIINLNKKYGDKVVLKDFNCQFEKNKVNFLMGPSGKGKTTLIGILMGLETYDSGLIDGIEGETIGAVFQEDRLCENLSVSVNIRMVHKDLNDHEKNNFIEKIKSVLDEVGLGHIESIPVNQLSGGMKRRVAILRCVLADRDIFIFDEALKGLDRESEKLFMKVIKPYIEHKTIIWVTHDDRQMEYFDDVNVISMY